jgi:ABC-2 type transport system ATP-binding protein
LPAFEGNVVSHEGKNRKRQQLIVRNPDPNALWQLRDDPGIAEVEVHTPSLEEIFVAFLSSPSLDQADSPQAPSIIVNESSGGGVQ